MSYGDIFYRRALVRAEIRLADINFELSTMPPRDRSTEQGRKYDNRKSLLYRQRKEWSEKLLLSRRKVRPHV